MYRNVVCVCVFVYIYTHTYICLRDTPAPTCLPSYTAQVSQAGVPYSNLSVTTMQHSWGDRNGGWGALEVHLENRGNIKGTVNC